MIQIVTIRQQILAALQRVYDSMGFDELLSADRIEKELLASFPPMAVALAPSDGFGEVALKLGYIKLEPGQCVVDTKVWLPYLVKAINAAKILQNHGAFTVKHYHGDWPSLEMLEGLLSAAIDRQTKDNTNA